MLLSQVSVSEAELALLVRLKGKLGPSGLQKYTLRADVAARSTRAERDDALGLRFHPGTPRHVRERARHDAEARRGGASSSSKERRSGTRGEGR
jgi:hypothetical protein